MVEIIPAIIARDFDELKEKIKLVEPYVKAVQIDVMDGIFAPNKNWPCFVETSASKNEPMELKNIETNLDLEAHLMVENPEEEIDKWLDSGVKRILVHWEAIFRNQESGIRNWEMIFKKCKEKNIEAGLVLNLETPIDILNEFQVLSFKFKVIQLMSIAKIGAHGEPFDEQVIPKIKALRRKWPDVRIEVDGGINPQNAKTIAQAGADILVVGSAIFDSPDISETIKYLSKLKSNKIK